MSIPAAYAGVVLIWSTTPLAIQWSGHEVGFLFGLSCRMLIGLTLLLCLHLLLKKKLRMDHEAWRVYIPGGLSLWGAMSCVYLAAQTMPSGWISVIFGTTPIVTGIMAALWLNEPALTRYKIGGILLALSGLAAMFYSGQSFLAHSSLGITLVFMSVLFHSGSAVWIKRINIRLDGISTTTGSLFIAVPLYITSWMIFDGHWPESIPLKASIAILYLGVAGSVIGFSLYYFLLTRLPANRLALITLITPVIALWLGQGFNGEIILPSTYFGTAIILLGLAVYEWGDHLWTT